MIVTMPAIDTVISDVARLHLRLQLTHDVGPIRLGRLVAHFGSVEAALNASMKELEHVEGISLRIAESIFASRGDDSVDREVERAAVCGLRIICREDPEYPKPLLNTPDPPICLYVRGKLKPTDAVALAIVGTRRCSHYGREQAVRFGEMLGAAGFTVISGLARGIDAEAHRGALQGGGRTIAVLGNGLGSIYPPEHASFAERIAGAGALLSEFPVDLQPAPENFPRRNRIIAGLSLGVIVVEAGRTSGALITARMAHDYNREVFAVPGRVDRPDLTGGVHGLIRDGQAKLVTSLDDILDDLGDVGDIMGRAAWVSNQAVGVPTRDKVDEPSDAAARTMPSLTGHEQAVLDAVSDGLDDPETIATTTGMDLARVMATLTSLQLKAMIRQLPGPHFVLRRSDGRG